MVMNKKQIEEAGQKMEERIKRLQNNIATLRAYRKAGDFTKVKESELIISICEMEEELEELLKEVKE